MKNRIYHRWNHWPVILLFVLGCVAGSCKDDDKEIPAGISPQFTAITPNQNVEAGSLITISGVDLNLVKAIRFGASFIVPKDSFIAEYSNASQLVLKLPAEAPNGSVWLIAADKTVPNVPAGTITVVGPTIESISPDKVTGGTELVITGRNLFLIKSIDIGSVKLPNNFILEEDSTILKVICPDKVTGGTVKIIARNNEVVYNGGGLGSVTPAITALSATVVDPMGGELTITGTDLNAVKQVLIGELDLTIDNGSRTNESLTVRYGDDIAEGRLKIVTSDGREITYTMATITLAAKEPQIEGFFSNVFEKGMLFIWGKYLKNVTRVVFANGDYVLAKDFVWDANHTGILLRLPESLTEGNTTARIEAFYPQNADFFSVDLPSGLHISKAIPTTYAMLNFDNLAASIGEVKNGVEQIESSVDGSKFGKISGEVITGTETTYFARNNRPNVSAFIFDNAALSFALRVDEISADAELQWQIRASSQNFFYAWPVGTNYTAGTDGWVRVDIPLSEFKTEADVAMTGANFAGSFSTLALRSLSGSGTIHILMDNISFVSGQ